MRAVVLGSAAGGGLPQWNCGCENCRLARAADPRVLPRTQSGLAVTVDGRSWCLVNASPDLRAQLGGTPDLWPRSGVRESPVRSVILTNPEVDHITGLLTLREGGRFTLWATARTHAALRANPIFDVLAPGHVERRDVALDEPFSPVPGLSARLFAVPGKIALWEERGEPEVGGTTDTTVGLHLSDGERAMAYVPGCAEATDALLDRLRGLGALLFDGTVFHDDDLARAGAGEKTGRRMGHVAMTGPGGSLARLADLGIGRRIYVHLNNTNPVLREGSPERAVVEAAGWIVAHDGLEVVP